MRTNIIIWTIILFAFSSCSDFLSYDENSNYLDSDVFATSGRAINVANHVYSYLQADFIDGSNGLSGASRSAGCDEAEYVWPTSNVHTFYDGTWSSAKTVDDQWGHYYAGIRAANFFLENGVGLTFDHERFGGDAYHNMLKNYRNYEFEVRFLRSFYYFELIKRYNNVPLIKKVLSIEEASKVEQNSFDEILKFIVEECDIVMEHLPITYNDAVYANQTGRITKAAAMALKSRALLYSASKLHNPDNDLDKWFEAAKAAHELIVMSPTLGFSSFPNFESVVSVDNFNSSEIILSKAIGASNYPESKNYPIGYEGGNTGNCPTQNLVNSYGMKRGQKYNPDDPYSPSRDPRFAGTIVFNNAQFCYSSKVDISEGSNNGLPANGATPTGYYLRKFLSKDVSMTKVSNTTSRHSYPIFRFAEIYLNYAEAMYEINGLQGLDTENGLTTTALQALNKIRARSGLTLAAYTAANLSTQEDFTKALRTERMAELAFEDHRFWDIRRWMIGPETTKIVRMRIEKIPDTEPVKYKYTEYESNNRIWDDKMYFYPIPLTEMFKNEKLIQNPGW